MVMFEDGGAYIGDGYLAGGTATCMNGFLSAGTHTVTAVYGGDANHVGSTSDSFSQTVNQASSVTSVTSLANPSVSGQNVTFIAAVSAVSPSTGIATGTVTFLDGGTSIGTGSLATADHLVANGDFENGDFSGWILGGNVGGNLVLNQDAERGTCAAWLGAIGSPGSLSQTVATMPGATYSFSWWLKSDGGTPNEFQASWDGHRVFPGMTISPRPTFPPATTSTVRIHRYGHRSKHYHPF